MGARARTTDVNRLIERKRHEDPAGFSDAEKKGSLREYLRDDLLKLGVNPDDFVFRRVRDVDIWDYIAVPLDMVYNRLFVLTSRNYQEIIDKLEQPRDDTYLRINNSLKRNKDLAFIGGVLLSLLAFWCFVSRRFNLMMAFFAASYEMLRISYNCFVKTYIVHLLQRRYGTIESLRTRGQIEQPLKTLSDSIDNSLLLEGTFIKMGLDVIAKHRGTTTATAR